MGHVQLPDELKAFIEQQVADGHAASETEFVAAAVRLYAGYLQTESEIGVMVERADADVAAGRYVTVTTLQDSEALNRRFVKRLHANLANVQGS